MQDTISTDFRCTENCQRNPSARNKPKQLIHEMRNARHMVDFMFALCGADFASR
jgi:hypothetical protein